jgi:hypothetical protein
MGISIMLSLIVFVATVTSIVVGILLWQKQGFTEEQGKKITTLEREVMVLPVLPLSCFQPYPELTLI